MLLQILVSFSQLSSRYSSLFRNRKQSNVKNKDVKGKESVTSLYDATICSESFEEAIRHLDRNSLDEMRSIDVRSVISLPGNSRSAVHQLPSLQSSKKVSYISSNSFENNKNGWIESPLATLDFGGKNRLTLTDNFVGLLSRSLRENRFQYNIQVRGFKTERSIHADLKRNPNLINRLRKFLGQYVNVY